jgi:glycogen debranching enzyme
MTDTSPWAPAGPVASLVDGGSPVTLVEGPCFCLCGRNGDIDPTLPQGVFFLDTRMLARWRLVIEGRPLEPLAVAHDAPYQATFLGRVRPRDGQADSEIVVFRHRNVGHGMREQVSVRNHGAVAAAVVLHLEVESDFADVFAVKESRPVPATGVIVDAGPTHLRFDHDSRWGPRHVDVTLSRPATLEGSRLTWELHVPPKGREDLCLEVAMSVDGHTFEPRFRCGAADEGTEPQMRLEQWRAVTPRLATDHPVLDRVVHQAVQDLGSLRIFDPEHPDAPVVAAGAPWFMTLFGRDSLLTSWMSLLVDPSLATGVVETLARLQGTVVDDQTEEEPGKILHEVRFERACTLALGGGSAYYGSVDATPLFVMLLGEVRRWGLADDVCDRLLPHADRALAWIDQYGDADGDGYVEYERRTPHGLANQGWKDSWDGISHADGELPRAPIALCEVQGYTYAAYLARAHFALEKGDQATFERYRDRAVSLKEAFNRDFWLDDRGWFAIGLDADKRPIDALASNMGHCLWTGIVDEDKAPDVARQLLSPEMFTGWGIRTLATSMQRYNPVSYHNGSVWPHDNALIAAGLMRYGFVDEAHQVIAALLDAADALGDRLPELFAGIDRAELPIPASYPASCSPQAWAAAAPLLCLRALLRFDPWVGHRRLHLAPVPLPGMGRLELRDVQVDAHRLTVQWSGDTTTVDGLDGIDLVLEPRPIVSRALS